MHLFVYMSHYFYAYVSFHANVVPVISSIDLAMLQQQLQSQTTGHTEIEQSLDLNISTSVLHLDFEKQCVQLPNGDSFTIPASFDPTNRVCYFIKEGNLYPLQLFDERTNFYYKLVPTSYRPIMRISATQMHKKPFLDFLETQKFSGKILDAGTGLGYSAIIASRSAKQLVTIEWDSNVIELASFNPHSRPLFESSNVQLLHGDTTKLIHNYGPNYFDSIIQDGGMPKSSGDFFSQAHAHQLFRVLKSKGNLYFYLPRKGISSGRNFAGEQIKRMQRAGFRVRDNNVEGSYTHFMKP